MGNKLYKDSEKIRIGIEIAKRESINDLTNHLSYLVLEAADMINISANLTVRVHENCDKEFLKKSVYYLLKNKNAWPRFCCDKTLTEGYMRNGIPKELARKRITEI